MRQIANYIYRIFIIHFVTCFKIGYIKYAPGTFGSLFAVLFFILTYKVISVNLFYIFILFITIIAVFSSGKYMKLNNSNYDPKEIIIDEFIGQIIILIFIYDFYNYINYYHIIISFILFRFFDITKILGIKYFDQNIKNSFGIIFDDILASIYSIFLFLIFNYIIYGF